MRNSKRAILILLICSCLSVCLTSTTVYAQHYQGVATDGTRTYYIDVTGDPAQPEVAPNGYIMGYVLDEEGNQVPGATVSLLLGNQLWTPDMYDFFPGKSDIYRCDNPQLTRIAYVNDKGFVKEGGFIFGLPLPDGYTLTAEKDGYKGSTKVRVGRESLNTSDSKSRAIRTNITLVGYHQPTFTPEQLSYTGAIVGEVRNTEGWRPFAYIYLLKDGQMVNMPYNPQPMIYRNFSGQNVDFMFMHMAPGNYTVKVEGNFLNGTTSVDVGTSIMRADVIVYDNNEPTNQPQYGFTPTVGEFSASDRSTTALPSTDSRPTPAPPGLLVLLAIGTAAYFIYEKNGKH